MPGPRPKPTYLKVLTGNPGHRPLPVDEPEPDGNLVDPPATMRDARQLAIWRQCIANAPEGLLKKLDENVLMRFVAAQANWEHANDQVARLGTVVNGPGNVPMQNPYLSILNNQAKVMRACSDEIGLSPAARSRVKIQGKKKSKSTFGKLKNFRIE